MCIKKARPDLMIRLNTLHEEFSTLGSTQTLFEEVAWAGTRAYLGVLENA